jgi:pimeloyl-ACP methyl ester carboxylesterase
MNVIRWIIRLLAVAAAAAIILYAIKDLERRALDDAARAGAPGKFVRLADGMTHYEVAGPGNGRVILFASAFSVPGFISDPLFQSLADSGFRVIRFDYYGRGWSDRIDAVYDQDLFVRQMAGLLDSLHVTGPVTVASVSYGAAMITSFADRYPDRVRALIYIDPVINNRRPLPPEERSRFAWDYHMVLKGGSDAMAEGQLYDFLYPDRHPDWVARYRVQQQFKGTREAWRRTRAAIAVSPDQMEQLRRVGTSPRPVLVIWGRQDPVAPFDESPAFMSALSYGVLVPVDSAGHMSHADQPDRVVATVMDFMRQS